MQKIPMYVLDFTEVGKYAGIAHKKYLPTQSYNFYSKFMHEPYGKENLCLMAILEKGGRQRP